MSQVYAIEITGYLKSGKINTKNASRQVTYENILEMHCQASLKLYTEEQLITESTLKFDAKRNADMVVDEKLKQIVLPKFAGISLIQAVHAIFFKH